MTGASTVSAALAAAAMGVGAQDNRDQTPDRLGTARHRVDVVEATIWDLSNALNDGRVTSRELVQMYLDRINRYEDRVNATATISASAMADATYWDRERAAGRVRGPLHGIPLGIKDIINTTNIPSYLDGTPANNFNTWPICAGPANGKGGDAACSVVFKYGMKRDFNLWLASLGPGAPVQTLTELRNYNLANQNRGAIKYGQAQFDISDEMDLEADRARYLADRARDIFVSRTHGIDEAMAAHKLDALLFPGSSSAGIAAKAGHPTVIVPFGFVPNAPTPAVPAGFDAKDQPYGVSFTGTACTEPRLIELAYAFEQATKRRVPPPNFP